MMVRTKIIIDVNVTKSNAYEIRTRLNELFTSISNKGESVKIHYDPAIPIISPRKKESKEDGENLQKAIHNLWKKRPAVMAKEKERLKKET